MIDVKKLVIPTAPLDVSLLKEKGVRVKKQYVSLEGKVGGRVDARDYRGNGHWKFPEEMARTSAIGFIYAIRNTINGRCYIGKKLYKSMGKLTKGAESNWRWYISSSKELDRDIREQFKEGFEFICIEEYASKGALSWAETFSICYARAPEQPDKWYNTLINKVSWKVKEPISDRHMYRLNKLMKGEVFNEDNLD